MKTGEVQSFAVSALFSCSKRGMRYIFGRWRYKPL